MNEREWLQSADARTMIVALSSLRGDDDPSLDQDLRRYYLACCRRIWRFLPQAESQRGVEVAERHAQGAATEEELAEANYYAEGAAFVIDYDTDPALLHEMEAAIRAIEAPLMVDLLGRSLEELGWSPRELLMRAAYFVDYAMRSHRLRPKRLVPKPYKPFLSADLLRAHIGNPFDGHPGADADTSRAEKSDEGVIYFG